MSEWLFWLALAAMLCGGRLVRVGLFLDRFAIGAAAAALSALVLDYHLEQQLHAFLFASAASLAIGRALRVRRPKAAA